MKEVYRIVAEADVCFNVLAESEEEAFAKAAAVVDGWADGYDLPWDEDGTYPYEARVYVDPNKTKLFEINDQFPPPEDS